MTVPHLLWGANRRVAEVILSSNCCSVDVHRRVGVPTRGSGAFGGSGRKQAFYDRGVQRNAIHARGQRRIATERVYRAPDLKGDLVKGIFTVGVLEGMRVGRLLKVRSRSALCSSAILALLIDARGRFLTPGSVVGSGARSSGVSAAEAHVVVGGLLMCGGLWGYKTYCDGGGVCVFFVFP